MFALHFYRYNSEYKKTCSFSHKISVVVSTKNKNYKGELEKNLIISEVYVH